MAAKKMQKKKRFGTVGTAKVPTVREGAVPKPLSPVGGGFGTVTDGRAAAIWDSRPRRVLLPWPPTVLNPNDRSHWRVKRAAVRAAREAAVEMVRATGLRIRAPSGPPRLRLTLQWFPPDHRDYDLDNLLARTKSALDGMCRALGLDAGKWGQGDAVFSSVLLRRCGRPVRRGRVVASIDLDPDALAFDELSG